MLGTVLGGIGLFLLGMSLLTDGLQAVAGDALRDGLRRFTRHRLAAVATGAVATAVVQSSSATSLLCIGFVAADLLSFTAALGVIFGANFGTTVTTWIVAGVGLKLKIDVAALPLVGIGALMKLILRGRRAGWGSAVAGFGLLFVGIGLLQEGMAGAASRFDLSHFGEGGLGTTVLLVLVGVVMTVVMQSSSAAVATTLAAVDTGAISLLGAAALVVGQNVGTTITAAIGAIGGGAAVKRTAAAHTVFNLGTGVVALALLPIVGGVDALRSLDPTLVLSGFHSAFNLLGLLIFVPFIPQLAAALERALPDAGASLTRRLALGRGAHPEAVLEAVRKTVRDVAGAAMQQALPLLLGTRSELPPDAHVELDQALARCRSTLDGLRTDPEQPHQYRAHVALLHALDHVARFVEALAEDARVHTTAGEGLAHELASELAPGLEQVTLWLESDEGPSPDIEGLSRRIASQRREGRQGLLSTAAASRLDGAATEAQLEAMRWVDRLGYHGWRAVHHLRNALADVGAQVSPTPESEGRRGDESFVARP